MVSRQPVLPQAQGAPAGSTTTWPISPAAQACPWTSAPPTTRPAPTPVLDPQQHQVRRGGAAEGVLGRGRRCWRRWRRRRAGRAGGGGCRSGRPRPSAGCARRAPRRARRPRRACRRRRRAPAGRWPARSRSARPTARPTASSPAGAVERYLGARLDLAGQVDHGPGHPVVGREVEGHDVGGVGSRPTSVGGLPTLLSAGAPSSPSRPSAMSPPTRSETVTRVRPVARARSAREAGPSANRCWRISERWWRRVSSASSLPMGRSGRGRTPPAFT